MSDMVNSSIMRLIRFDDNVRVRVDVIKDMVELAFFSDRDPSIILSQIYSVNEIFVIHRAIEQAMHEANTNKIAIEEREKYYAQFSSLEEFKDEETK